MSCNPTELKWKCNTPTVSGPQLLLPWVPLTQISVLEKLLAKAEYAYRTGCNGSFTLKETDLHTDSDSDSKPKQYIVACRTCSHCADKDSDPYSLLVCLHCPTPRPIINGFYRIVWSCLHCTDTDTDTDYY